MPDFTGMEYRQAQIELDRMGITYREEWEFDDKVEKNKIISTTPGKGEDIGENLTVVLQISKGKELKNVKVPDLKGVERAERRDSGRGGRGRSNGALEGLGAAGTRRSRRC